MARARMPLQDALVELEGLADDARDLAVFDRLLPRIGVLDETSMLVLIGLLMVDESIHQALHTAHLYRYGSVNI